MPAKNVLKTYLTDGFYHIYNRGVEKRDIFQDDQDYKVLLSYLKSYLEPKDELSLRNSLSKTPYPQKDKILKQLQLKNYADQIDLLAFCLLPNHFHFLIKQNNQRGIEGFMRSLGTRYSTYFNKKYGRIGGLFQDAYKAVLVENDEQLLHLSRYIHRNPYNHPQQGVSLLKYGYSSLPAYLEKWHVRWLKPDYILSFFSKNINFSYQQFVLIKGFAEE